MKLRNAFEKGRKGTAAKSTSLYRVELVAANQSVFPAGFLSAPAFEKAEADSASPMQTKFMSIPSGLLTVAAFKTISKSFLWKVTSSSSYLQTWRRHQAQPTDHGYYFCTATLCAAHCLTSRSGETGMLKNLDNGR